MKMFKDLVGAKIVSLTERGFEVVLKSGEERHFEFLENRGDCCGYNEFQARLLFEENSESNPIITKVEETNEIDFEHFGTGDSLKITFFGEYKPIAEIQSFSSSGSGYSYGACVTCRCWESREKENITEW